MNTLFRSTIAFAVLGGARAAHASCSITGLKPDDAMLPTMDVGQEFTFVASGDCVTLRFHVADSKLTKIPKSGSAGSDKEATYKVVLTEREWNMVSAGRDELTWSINGISESTGDIEREMETNDIDHDLHFKLGVAEADAKITGEAMSDEAGTSVSSAGDVNGDGKADVLIGAPHKGYARGAAYVVMGPVSGDVDLSFASFLGEEAGDKAGTSVSYVDDVNGDDYDELLIGAPGNNAETGAAYLLYGPVTEGPTPGDADVKLVGEGAGDLTGFSVSGTGDVDGDLIGDLLVGSFWQADEPRTGAAYLVLGATLSALTDPTLELSKADAKLLGPTRDDPGLGVNVARGGDVDGDGTDDLAVGLDWNDEFGAAGRSFTFSNTRSMEAITDMEDMSQPGIVRFSPESLSDAASALSGAGDVNGDGYDDLLIGASDNITGGLKAGSAYLILGPFMDAKSEDIELADADAKFVGEDPGDRAGAQVSSAGNVNGDDYDDILIGACGNNDGAGAAYLVLGPITGTEETKDLSRSDVKLTGEAAGDCAGFGVSSAGDVDGDELDDVLVGAPGNADGAGAAYVFGGATLSLLTGGTP